MNRGLQIISAILILVLVAGGSFYGGMVYGKSQTTGAVTLPQGAVLPGSGQRGQFQFPNQNQQGEAGQRFGGQGGGLFGEIVQIGDGLIVVKDSTGKETQVHVTDTTLIEKNASVTLADLATGETVIVSGNPQATRTP